VTGDGTLTIEEIFRCTDKHSMKVVGLNRRLAALMFTDMVGYSALTESDETRGLELLEEHRAILRNRVAEFGGREIKSTGDGFLIEFGSVIDAVQCAIQVQTAFFERNLTVPDERRLRIRIGIHLGDIVDTDQDAHGNGINIAARIEPFARPGSIAVSQQVVDQVRGHVNLPVKKMGRLALKNLESPPEVYRFLLPWESAAREPSFREIRSAVFRGILKTIRSPTHASLGTAVLGALTVGAVVFAAITASPDPSPDPSAAEAASRLLPNHWEIALGAKTEKGAVWRLFDPSRAREFIDAVEGPYLLRLRFPAVRGFEHPALVLGLIAQKHEAYLNGKFIGASKSFSALSAYSVGTELSADHENELLIRAESRPSLTPGLYVLPGIAPQIGEYDFVTGLVDSQRYSYQVAQTFYLVVCLLTALATFLYAAFRRRRKHFYSALFLAMGAIGVSFYNGFVMQAFDYRVYRFLNLLAFAGSIVALVSIDLESREKRRFETWNNFGGLAFSGLAAAVLLGGSIRPSTYLFRLEVLFGILAAYSGIAFAGFLRGSAKRRLSDTYLVRAFGALLFAVLSSIFVAKAPDALGWNLPRFSVTAYDYVRQTAILYPIAFALSIFAISITDYIRKSQENSYKRRKDDLVLGLAGVIARSVDFEETVREVQIRVADFLKADRSTIYLLDSSGRTLRAEWLHGSARAKSAVVDTLDATTGIVGYCLKIGAPVWVEDIGRDERFREAFLARTSAGEAQTYRTGSFIVAPIQIGRKTFGVITIADRKDGHPFTAGDFCLMHLAAKDLSLLVSQLKADGANPLKLVA
jgi:class 3 adenylate cyclase